MAEPDLQRCLLLYTTLGCHLCEQAQAMVAAFQQADPGLQLQLVEIADSDDLMLRYGVRIPVLRFQDQQAELGWPFDWAQLAAFLGLSHLLQEPAP